MSLLSRVGALAALALMLFAVVGCGGTDLDATKTEEEVKENVEKTQGIKVSSVDCPSGIAVEPKTKFSCTIHLSSGKTATGYLLIRDKDANLNFLRLQLNK